jgi:hypothetical protein
VLGKMLVRKIRGTMEISLVGMIMAVGIREVINSDKSGGW